MTLTTESSSSETMEMLIEENGSKSMIIFPTRNIDASKSESSLLDSSDKAFLQSLVASSTVFASLLPDVHLLSVTSLDDININQKNSNHDKNNRNDAKVNSNGIAPETNESSSSDVQADQTVTFDDPIRIAARTDEMEIRVRAHVLELERKIVQEDSKTSTSASIIPSSLASFSSSSTTSTTSSSTLDELGEFWMTLLQVCHHIVMVFPNHYDKYLHIPQFRKLPFQVLDDILDGGLQLSTAQQFWMKWFNPPSSSSSSSPRIPFRLAALLENHSPSSLILLKTLNSFWKRCAAAGSYYTLSQSSSMNDPHPPQHTNTDIRMMWSSEVLQTLASAFPLSERSALRVWGSRNTATHPEPLDDPLLQASSLSLSSSSSSEPQTLPQIGGASATDIESNQLGLEIDSDLYQCLWSLQQDFYCPFVKNVGEFLARIKKVLRVFETTPVLALPDRSADTHLSPEIMSPYLASAHLLPYQIRDATFRSHILAQLIIVADHVANEAPNVGSQLEESRKLAIQLLQADHPALQSALQDILTYSEPRWIRWKKHKCSPPLDEKPPTVFESNSSTPLLFYNQESARSRKRRKTTSRAGSVHGASLSSLPVHNQYSHFLQEAATAAIVPTLADHLNRHGYIDALDPGSGIEEEYHPKNNAFFCWQAFRLLPVTHLDKVRCGTGDFEYVVRHVWKHDMGIDIPRVADTDEIDDEDIGDNDEEGSGAGVEDGDDDGDVDDGERSTDILANEASDAAEGTPDVEREMEVEVNGVGESGDENGFVDDEKRVVEGVDKSVSVEESVAEGEVTLKVDPERQNKINEPGSNREKFNPVGNGKDEHDVNHHNNNTINNKSMPSVAMLHGSHLPKDRSPPRSASAGVRLTDFIPPHRTISSPPPPHHQDAAGVAVRRGGSLQVRGRVGDRGPSVSGSARDGIQTFVSGAREDRGMLPPGSVREDRGMSSRGPPATAGRGDFIHPSGRDRGPSSQIGHRSDDRGHPQSREMQTGRRPQGGDRSMDHNRRTDGGGSGRDGNGGHRGGPRENRRIQR